MVFVIFYSQFQFSVWSITTFSNSQPQARLTSQHVPSIHQPSKTSLKKVNKEFHLYWCHQPAGTCHHHPNKRCGQGLPPPLEAALAWTINFPSSPNWCNFIPMLYDDDCNQKPFVSLRHRRKRRRHCKKEASLNRNAPIENVCSARSIILRQPSLKKSIILLFSPVTAKANTVLFPNRFCLHNFVIVCTNSN